MTAYKIEKNCTECCNFYQEDSCCECDAEESLFGSDICDCCIYHIVETDYNDRMKPYWEVTYFGDFESASVKLSELMRIN